jgi:hypothetical protein
MENVKWFEIKLSESNRQISSCDRTAGYNADSGEVFLPASVFGGEKRNLLCMSFDGINIMIFDGRLFCPASWLKKEFPGMAWDISAIMKRVIQFAEGNNEHS